MIYLAFKNSWLRIESHRFQAELLKGSTESHGLLSWFKNVKEQQLQRLQRLPLPQEGQEEDRNSGPSCCLGGRGDVPSHPEIVILKKGEENDDQLEGTFAPERSEDQSQIIFTCCHIPRIENDNTAGNMTHSTGQASPNAPAGTMLAPAYSSDTVVQRIQQLLHLLVVSLHELPHGKTDP